MTKTRKQKYLDTFVQQLHGKGRAVTSAAQTTKDGVERCLYVKRNHPGCAIGCQPEFKEVQKLIPKGCNYPVEDLIVSYPSIKPILTGPHGSNKDIEFLCSLQNLHDLSANWDGKNLRVEAVREFAKTHGLKVPMRFFK